MGRIDLRSNTILLTGAARFIGSNLAERLFADVESIKVVGLDNMNDYYDVCLNNIGSSSWRSLKDSHL